MLNAIGVGASGGERKTDWGQVWLQSEEYSKVSVEIKRICHQRRNEEPTALLLDEKEYSTTFTTQLAMVMKRTFISYWRDPNYLLGKLPQIFKLVLTIDLCFML